MNYYLEECIKDSFENTMKDYLESSAYKEESWVFNQMYFAFRDKLSPTEQTSFDEICTALHQSDQALALESYYRGVVLGTAQIEKVLSDLGIK